MKLSKILAAGALVTMAACGQIEQPEAEAPAAPAPPAALMDQALAQAPEMQQVFAYQQLVVYMQANPALGVSCEGPRGIEARGIIPDSAAADSVYGALKGALAFSVQCGPQLTTARDEPREHWLVAFAPGAAAPSVVNCADARGRDQCPRAIPMAAATP